MRKLRKNKRCTLDVWAHQGSGQSSCETCTSLLSLSKALPSELLNPQLLTCTHLTNGSCEKMRCQGEGAAGVELSRGHREAELCPFLNIYFHPKPLWVWGHGGPFWCLSAWMALWASSVEISAGKKDFSKGGMNLFSSSLPVAIFSWAWLVTDRDRRDGSFQKHKLPYNAWLLQVRNYSSQCQQWFLKCSDDSFLLHLSCCGSVFENC